jgi:hypothetical protein
MSRDTNSLGTFVTFCAGQACRPGARRAGTGSGCGGANTAMHFGQTIGSLLRSKNFVSQLVQRRFVPSSDFVTSDILAGRAELQNSTAVRRLLIAHYNKVSAQGTYSPSRSVPFGTFLVLTSGPDRFLSDRGHRPEIVFGVLVIVLGLDGVTC